MKNNKNQQKDNLYQEINNLQRDVLNYTNNELEILKDINDAKREKNKLKAEYKIEKKKLRKNKVVKNLVTTAYIALIASPFILGIGSTVGSSAFSIKNLDFGYSYNDVYLDNTGKEEILDYDVDGEFILIKTPWKKTENNDYERKIYNYEHSNIKDDNKDVILNTDYLTLLQEYNFDYKRTETTDKINPKDKDAVVAVISEEKGEFSKIDKNLELGLTIFAMCLVGFLTGVGIWIFKDFFLHDTQQSLEEKKYELEYKIKKSTAKKLKKELKNKKM